MIRLSWCVGSLWSPKSRPDDKRAEVQTTLRELIIYLIFLIIMSTGSRY
jgi:hypothetical protein